MERRQNLPEGRAAEEDEVREERQRGDGIESEPGSPSRLQRRTPGLVCTHAGSLGRA